MVKNFTILIFCLITFSKIQAQVGSSVSPLFGCPPLVVNLHDSSGGSPTSYHWDFDNGTSNLKDATASYTTSGVYNILHVVCYGTVCDSENILVRVFKPPTVDFGAPDRFGCVEPCHNVNFTNLTIPGESPVFQYVWDFGDGALPVSSYNASHCYDSVNNFKVTLVARDSNGCQSSLIKPNYVMIGRPPTATITASPSQSCYEPMIVHFSETDHSTNGPVTYEWYFDTLGLTSSLQNPVLAYYNGIYNPFLIVTDSLGCEDTAFTHIEVTRLHAAFTVANVNACQNIPIQFNDTSNFASSWKWDFGDPASGANNTSSLKGPTHSYTSTGTKTVSLIIGYNGCSDTLVKTAYVSVTPPVNFTISASSSASCAPPLVVNYTASTAGNGITWKFGDGTTSNVQNPQHTYTIKGSYSDTVSVTNTQGCVNTQVYPNYVSVADIKAGFTVDTPGGCAPVTIHFTSTSNSNPGITNYHWFFGNGDEANGTSPNQTYVYNTQGLDTAKLVVTNSAGCTDTAYFYTIKIGSPLKPNFIAAPLVQCVDQPVKFIDSTSGVTPQTTFDWLFGDGNHAFTENASHAYTDTGTYTITLTIKNQGCITDTVRLRYIEIIVPKADFTDSFGCNSPTSVIFKDKSKGADTWLWSFGDGSPTVTTQNPSHNYPSSGTYKVTLTVSNSITHCVDSISKTIVVGNPTTKFTADTFSGCYPLTIHFKDSSLLATSQLWNFGDKFTSNALNPIHTYSTPGSYTVKLYTNPGSACMDSLVKVNYITVYGPTANLGINPPVGCVPLNAAFVDSSVDFGGTITAWSWKFGVDTITGSGIKNPHYTYDTSGTFNVTLKVTDSHGCTSSASKSVTAIKPVANFKSDTAICPGEPVRFTNLSTNANKFSWAFGDGGTSTATNPVHTYTISGVYDVTLTITDSVTGCMANIVKAKYMYVDSPHIDFSVNKTFLQCPPFPVQFTTKTDRPNLDYTWYFGDGGTQQSEDPLHVYFFPGNYDVTLIASDTAGCTVKKTYTDLIILKGPVGHFTVSPDTGCVPVTITVTGSVSSTSHIIADFNDGTVYNDTINVVHTYTVPSIYYPTYILFDSLGCKVAYPIDTIVVGLIPYPGLPVDTTVCKGNYVQYNLPYGDHFLWQSNLSQTYLSCDTCQAPLSTSPDTITYYVTAITNIGCIAKDTTTIYADALPIIFPGLHYSVCPNDTIQLTAGKNVASATWSPDMYINDTALVNPKVWPPDSTTYRVTGRNESGCSISRIVRVFAIKKVESNVGFQDTLLCGGTALQLDAQVISASSNDTFFRWTPPNFLSSATIANPVLSAPSGTYDFTVVVTSATCTPDTDRVHIVIAPVPLLEAGDDQIVTPGTFIQLWANSADDVTYRWNPVFDSLSCDNCSKPTLHATQSETIYVTAENAFGCTVIDSVVIQVVSCDDKMVFVPNTFTPNGDGKNEKLFVRGIGLRQLEYFRVFDRWGRMVWQTNDINVGWDGQIDGKLADIATYVYVVRGICASGQEMEKSGNVTLVR